MYNNLAISRCKSKQTKAINLKSHEPAPENSEFVESFSQC